MRVGPPRGAFPQTRTRLGPRRPSARRFARLAPQGSDTWNFLAAFTHLGDRYGPYHPGASALSDALETERQGGARRPRRLDRLRGGRDRAGRATGDEQTELAEAMGHVVEAFRFLSARVATLEARLAAQDRPVDGAAWLVPARDLGPWLGPVAAHVLARTPGGDIVHADCGEGSLLHALAGRGATVRGSSRAVRSRCGLSRADARSQSARWRTIWWAARPTRSAASC